MDRHGRFALLAKQAVDDREHGLPGRARFQGGPVGIRTVRMPGGGTTRLLRVMQTNACSLSCGYCPTFAGGKVKRVTLSPEEVATTFMEAHRAGVADGLFLTSGVPGRPVRAMDRMLAAVDILRKREGFSGYVHVKLLPGPTRIRSRGGPAGEPRLDQPRGADRRGGAAPRPREGPHRRPATQAHPGGATVARLAARGATRSRRAGGHHHSVRRRRAGRDGPAAPGPGEPARAGRTAPPRPFQRLPAGGGHAHGRPAVDAGRSRVQAVPGRAPVAAVPVPIRRPRLRARRQPGPRSGPEDGVGSAPPRGVPRGPATRRAREMLLRVPGIGPRAADRLIAARRQVALRGPADLRRLGVDVGRGGFFMTLGGRPLAPRPPAQQLRLFPHGGHLPAVVWNTPVPPCAYR